MQKGQKLPVLVPKWIFNAADYSKTTFYGQFEFGDIRFKICLKLPILTLCGPLNGLLKVAIILYLNFRVRRKMHYWLSEILVSVMNFDYIVYVKTG